VSVEGARARPAPDVKEIGAELGAGVAGQTFTRLRDRERYRSNFGNLYAHLPAIVVVAREPGDVAHVLRVARRAEMPVSVRGRGHSFGRQGLSEGGIVVVNRVAAPTPRMVSDTVVEVSAASTWRSVECALNRVGRSFGVLTNEPEVSVGGTLAVGGYGEASVAGGAQVAHVQALSLFTADGKRRTCSASHDPELFRHALATLGQVGVLASVRLTTRPRPAGAAVRILVRPTLAALVAELCRMCDDGALDFMSGQHYDGQYVGTFGVHLRRISDGRLPRPRGSSRWRVVPDWHGRSLRERRRTTWRADRVFAWGDYVVDAAEAPRFADHVQRVVEHPAYARFGGRLLVLLVAGGAVAARFPLEPLPPTRTGPAVGFGVYLQAPVRETGWRRELRAIHQGLLTRCLEQGGRPYLSGTALPRPADMEELYAEGYRNLKRLRARFDPLDLLNREALWVTP
jgi:FAD/FMN-containing dehydrogenase